jgi:hypothetical protein
MKIRMRAILSVIHILLIRADKLAKEIPPDPSTEEHLSTLKNDISHAEMVVTNMLVTSRIADMSYEDPN